VTKLTIRGVTRTFGAFVALDTVSFAMGDGERRAIIGPNGAGKSTLFAIIGGQLSCQQGAIAIDDKDITRLSPAQRCTLGLGRTFQRNNLFGSLTTLENVRLAVQAHSDIARNFFHKTDRFRDVEDEGLQRLVEIGLSDYRNIRADQLSYGDQRRLEIAIALAANPKILLVDEPTAGMSASETDKMVELLVRLPSEMSVLIVEHDMDVIASVTNVVTVLHHGRVLAEGPWDVIRYNPEVRESYLGQSGSESAAC
jgi:branched-chain amino acid transport system ATP-binding protein